MTKAEWIEENRDALEQRYYEAYKLNVCDYMDEGWEAFKTFEKALVQMGILEADEVIENPEDISEADHWYEWEIDHQIDMEMDRLSKMAYERASCF